MKPLSVMVKSSQRYASPALAWWLVTIWLAGATVARGQNEGNNFANVNEELNNFSVSNENSADPLNNTSNSSVNNFENFSLNGNDASFENSENVENGSENVANNNALENNTAFDDNSADEELNNTSNVSENAAMNFDNGSNVADPQSAAPAGALSNTDSDPLAALGGPSPVTPQESTPPLAPQTDPLAGVAPGPTFEKYDPQLRQFNDGLKRELQQRLEADLRVYCFDYCSVLAINVSSSEVFDAVTPDLGFDDSSNPNRSFSAEKVTADVLVDLRYGAKNVDRLKKLIEKVSTTYPYPIEVIYSLIEMPDSDATAKGLAEVKGQFVRRIASDLDRLVRDFCPDECRISNVQVQVEQASIDDLTAGAQNRYIHARGSRGAIFVKGVSASLSLNGEMRSDRRRRIENLFREVLQPYGDINLLVSLLNFPISASEIERERDDPYGLEKLRQMLKILKEFSGTKEVIKESESSVSSESSESIKESQTTSSQSSSSRDTTQASTVNSEKKSSFSESEASSLLGMSQDTLYLVAGVILVAMIILVLGLRYVMSAKRVQHVIREGMTVSPEPALSNAPGMQDPFDGGVVGATRTGVSMAQPPPPPVTAVLPVRASSDSSADLVRTLTMQRLKDELTQIFIRQPKVAREVFGRIIREDGIQHAAKCVAVFGEIVTFELLDDSELKDSLATLAEYVHRNVPHIDTAEEIQLLESLKLRVAAGKIRVMADKGLGSFDFLKAKSPRQIYNLIVDESAQSQSVVLTQLSKSKRNAVFDLFEGESKIELLRALCQGRVVANEYLLSLSDALRRKAQRSGIFDQGLTSGVDVLLDLLAQSSLADQQVLMGELDSTNPEAARMVRSSLVTPETLQFIRDGLLIDIFLGLEAQTLATFLAGCPDHIRNMILGKVPQDLAQDWFDLMSSMPSMDSETYKLAELQILQKIRSFSESGMISLLEINQSIFPEQRSSEVPAERGQRRFRISQSIVA